VRRIATELRPSILASWALTHFGGKVRSSERGPGSRLPWSRQDGAAIPNDLSRRCPPESLTNVARHAQVPGHDPALPDLRPAPLGPGQRHGIARSAGWNDVPGSRHARARPGLRGNGISGQPHSAPPCHWLPLAVARHRDRIAIADDHDRRGVFADRERRQGICDWRGPARRSCFGCSPWRPWMWCCSM
jgi:hypothetical protein